MEKFNWTGMRVPICPKCLMVSDEIEYKHHISKCKPVFSSDGNQDVKTDQQQEIAIQFAIFSKNETGKDYRSVTKKMFNEGLRAFIFVDKYHPIGFIPFKKVVLEDLREIYVVCDMFTFPKFRGRGIASDLLNFGIEQLKIDRKNIACTFPVEKSAQNIILNNAIENVIRVRGNFSRKFIKEELSRYWVESAK